MAEAKSIQDVFWKTDAVLATAKYGLSMATGPDATVRMIGVHNVAVGRAVSNALQNLRTVCGTNFDAWYADIQAEMKASELCRYFIELRNEILKEGPPEPTGTSVYVAHFSSEDVNRFPQPPGATNFILGDRIGGNGWLVQLPDGTTQMFYVAVPPDLVTNYLHLPDPPKSHLNGTISDTSIGNLATIYLGYLESIVESTKAHFLS
jgi:hypothetical protein